MTQLPVGEADGRSAWTITDGVRTFAVFVVGDATYVTDAACPHRGGPLVEGRVRDGDRPGVVCPWHWYVYDLADGRCRTTDAFTLRTYPVVETDGVVLADIGEPPAVRSWSDILREHARA